MKTFFIAETIFDIIMLLLIILFQIISEQNHFIKIVLCVMIGIVFLGMVFILGFIKGNYKLSDSFVSLNFIVASVILLVCSYLSNIIINNKIKK